MEGLQREMLSKGKIHAGVSALLVFKLLMNVETVCLLLILLMETSRLGRRSWPPRYSATLS